MVQFGCPPMVYTGISSEGEGGGGYSSWLTYALLHIGLLVRGGGLTSIPNLLGKYDGCSVLF
jgi:hypothetical protein